MLGVRGTEGQTAFRANTPASATFPLRSAHNARQNRAAAPKSAERNVRGNTPLNRVRTRSIFAAIAVICAGCSPAGEPTGERAAAPLSGDQDTSDWLEYADSERGISFRYPPDFGTQFIRALDWPPMLELLAGPFECTEAGEETARRGQNRALHDRRPALLRQARDGGRRRQHLYVVRICVRA